MAKLPTKEELEQLYHEKGHYALEQYLRREALRALPLLTKIPFEELWRPSYDDHSCFFDFFRIFFIPRPNLFGYPAEKKIIERFVAATTYIEVVNDEYIDSTCIHLDEVHKDPEILRKIKLSESAISRTVAIMDTKTICNDVLIAPNLFKKEFKLAARRDFELLIANNYLISRSPLWPEGFKPEGMALLEKKLLETLSWLGFEFLSQDLQSLWDMKPLGDHAKNYLKNISEADLNNPEALRRIILGNESDKIHAVRTLLLGSGGAGKSSLADRLQGNPVEKIKPATQGIEYLNHQPINLQKTFPQANPEEKDLNLYLWDFGGQTIFHGLHRAFLHENCVYILVVDSRHEQAPDEWLHQIRHIAGSNATVLLVTNQHDGCDIRQNEKRLLREFGDLLDKDSFHYFSCIESDTSELEKFVDELVKASLSSQRTVWSETLNIHQAIREHTEQNDTIFIPVSKIKQIITANGRVEDSKAMITSLEQLGFLARITKGKLSYCLKPEWAVDHAYELLYSDTLREAKGQLDPIDFDTCFAKAPTDDQQEKLLNFLENRSLCFTLPDAGDTYFFPDAAKADEPEKVAELLKQEQRLVIRFDLPYLPLGFHTRLVKPLFNTEAGIQSAHHIWRQGFIVQLADSHAVVQYLLRKSSIEFTLTGNPQHYARLLETFHASLTKTVAEKGNGKHGSLTITPFVLLDEHLFRATEKQLYSVHSVSRLIDALKSADGDLEIFTQEIPAMAGNPTTINNTYNAPSQTSYGDNATNTQHNHQPHTEITTDQCQQIATIVGELLKEAATLPPEQIIAAAEVKKALEAPADDEKAKSLLSTTWQVINEAADFTKDKAIPLLESAIKHKELLGAAFATAAATCSTLPLA